MRENTNKKQTKLLGDLASSRQQILDLVTQIPPDQQNVPFLGKWCVKDLLAHMIGWDVTNQEAVQEILSGQRPHFFQHYDKDWQSYNDRLVAAYRKEPFEALLADAASSHERLLDFLRALPPEAILEGKYKGETGRTVTIRNLLRAEAADEMKHVAQVRAFLEQTA